MKVNDVVQFTENHQWCGCLGIITEDKGEEHPRRYMIGVPVPIQGTTYIFDDGSGIECIGKAVLVEGDMDVDDACPIDENCGGRA